MQCETRITKWIKIFILSTYFVSSFSFFLSFFLSRYVHYLRIFSKSKKVFFSFNFSFFFSYVCKNTLYSSQGDNVSRKKKKLKKIQMIIRFHRRLSPVFSKENTSSEVSINDGFTDSPRN